MDMMEAVDAVKSWRVRVLPVPSMNFSFCDVILPFDVRSPVMSWVASKYCPQR